MIDVSNGQDIRSGAQLKRGQAQHRLLQTLCSDFYIPFRTETVFSYLFADEHYNPINSNKRTQAAVARPHEWFNDNKIPIDIRRKGGEHRIYVVDPYSIKVQLSYDNGSAKFDVDGELEKFLKGGQARSMEEICAALDVPMRTLYRKVQGLLEKKKVLKKRSGAIVLYQWNQ